MHARVLLMLGLAVPAVLFSTLNRAIANPVMESVSVNKESKPFIAKEARRDTLGNLNKLPIGDVIRNNDGGTGKEACDKCKESCDSPCGSITNPGDRIILPGDKIKVPGKIQPIQSPELIRGAKPIF